MRFMCSCLLAICAGWSGEAWAINCPNKPSGATTLATVHFDTSNGEGQLWEIYPGAGQIRQPAGAEGNASASILYAGQPTGGQQTIWPNPGSQQPLNNLYVCLRFQMAPGYVGQQTANKLFFVAAQDWPFGRQGGNGFFGLNGSGYPSSNGYRLYFGHNSGNLDNSHVCAQDLGLGGCFPNVAQTSMFPGNWYTVEVRAISSTSSTSRNGVMQWWIDGALNGNFTNLNYIDGTINQFQINHTWDGGGAVQCGPPTNPANALGRDCRVDQIYYFDELVVAAGGASNPPPPPPPTDTTPPGQVTSVTVTQLN